MSEGLEIFQIFEKQNCKNLIITMLEIFFILTLQVIFPILTNFIQARIKVNCTQTSNNLF